MKTLQGMRTLQEYLDLPYHVSVVRGENERGKRPWSASVDELPACTAAGSSPEEAVQRLREAMEKWIAAAIERNEDIPEPRSDSTHSGRLLVRMPKTLHGRLTRAAEQEGVSLNQFINGALASAVGWRDLERAARNSRPKDDQPGDAPAAGGEGFRAWLRENLLAVALVANFVVVAAAGVVAIALFLAAWRLDSDDEPTRTPVTNTSEQQPGTGSG
jgi:antitoxin HicB